jgi:hypothetical protein
MSLKIINLTILEESMLNIGDFSPEENYLMLKIGSQCLLEGRKAVAGLTQKEIHEKIKNETFEEIEKLKMNILFEKKLSKRMEEELSEFYDKQLEVLSNQIKEYENDLITHKVLLENSDKFISLYLEKVRENQKNIDKFAEKILSNQ